MDLFQGNEEAQLIKDGKIDEVIKRRTERMQQDHQTAIDGLTKKVETSELALQAANERIASLVIDDALTKAATELACEPTAIPDILSRGRSVFSIKEDGGLDAHRPDGTLFAGSDPTKAITPEGRLELESVGSLIGYIPASNEDFASLRETIEHAFANDPEGWADFKAAN